MFAYSFPVMSCTKVLFSPKLSMSSVSMRGTWLRSWNSRVFTVEIGPIGARGCHGEFISLYSEFLLCSAHEEIYNYYDLDERDPNTRRVILKGPNK